MRSAAHSEQNEEDERWRILCSSSAFEQPLLGNGLVYLAQQDGQVIALDASSGSLRWRYAAPEALYLRLIADGILYAGSFSESSLHSTYALGASDGALLWQTWPYDTRVFIDTLSTPLTVAAGLLYLELQTAAQPANSDAAPPWVLVALDPTTGHVVWKHDLGGRMTLLTARDGVVYGGWLRLDQSGTGQLIALNANNGTAFWTVDTAFSTVIGG